MNRNYLLYEEAKNLINGNPKLKKKLQTNEIDTGGLYGFTSEEWVYDNLKELLSKVPSEKRRFGRRILSVIGDVNSRNWIKEDARDFKLTSEEPEKEVMTIDDMRLYTAEFTGNTFRKKDLFLKYKEFGFDSPMSFISTISVYNINKVLESREYLGKNGYSFITTKKDGKKLKTEIKGNSHYDFLLEQKDITEMEITSPFGERSLVRPLFYDDVTYISGSHSIETDVLFSFLRYAKDVNAKISYFEDKNEMKKLIDWAIEQGDLPLGGGCTEHLSGGIDKMGFGISKHNFENYPLMKIDSEGNVIGKFHFCHTISMYAAEGCYFMLIGENNELIIIPGYKHIFEKKKISGKQVIINKENIEDLIKAMLYQSAKGLGRTSVVSIIKALECGYEEYRKRNKIK